ncbi:MAG: hypothetical protein U9R42_07195, partial [Bacteroidota bacterium]|nr:hypothetical protein [Bacteroidota bacterium]
MTSINKYFSIILLFMFFLIGCSESGKQQNGNVLEGNFWKNQALTDILPYWTKYSIDTVDGAFITNLDRSFNQIE